MISPTMGTRSIKWPLARARQNHRKRIRPPSWKLDGRERLSEAFLKDLHAEWERSGQAALKILAVENPAMLAGLVAKVIPQAFDSDTPAVLHIITGVPRHGDLEHYPNRAPQIPQPPFLRWRLTRMNFRKTEPAGRGHRQ
jgi:hypothetical protein